MLLEVIVAITLLMVGTIGGFQIYNVISKKTHALHEMKDQVLLSEQAICRLLELLYTNTISWGDVATNGAIHSDLNDGYAAQFQFYPVKKDEEDEDEDREEEKNILNRDVQITLTKEGKEIKIEKLFPICVKKE